ncbi:phenylalanine--tRNA ligase subunit beta [Simplicispira hankyongi]|uniref:Phenylalanine--tRNA ligase beta subunit n=1 Tax=Simplicispira hankyongi TaxID=2315688 RepID=A0A398CES4_9BURK|nr:phenylalanine--tRNA ligase subunit beta [Simplicispira hankyongi]RID99417.1 phenylalanine--tRNA ligase subunit beta [Simplicispira hankyongi]
MQFPESWLRQFCNPPLSTQELADTLTMAGMEVEELRPVAPPFTGVVVGEIREAVQHPDADRLRICQVDIGQAQLLNIVCGAPNARVGIKVPCAVVGAQLPPGEDGKPFAIRVGKLRGVESFGMLCSAKELKLSDDHGGLLELASEAPLGANVRDVLALDDTLFTLKLTPNLAHCLSVFGVAREVAALTGSPLMQPNIGSVSANILDTLPVKISAPDLCGRFSGRIVRRVNPRASTPAWMVERLARCGQRSVSPLVDISNYVMFELGRPSHIFDLGKIHGGLDVRWARVGERLALLNGSTVDLDERVGVIADEVQVESLAGIMGGDATAVSDDTQDIYIEAAFWWPAAVAGRSRQFRFATEAGHRFERGVDPEQTVLHIERITQLVLDICGTPETVCGPVDDQQPRMPQRVPVSLRVSRAAKVIGMPLSQAQCAEVLTRLGLEVVESADVLTVTPPLYRFDFALEEDLIEEVARIVGYGQLPDTPPLAPVTPTLREERRRSPFTLRRQIASLGYQETINFSFVDEGWERELTSNTAPIRLLNPISSQMSVMRSSLLGSLLQVLKYNADRRAERVRVFEIGRIFLRDASVQDSDNSVAGYHQPQRVAGLAFGPADGVQWSVSPRNVDFFDIKGDVEALLAPRVPVFEAAEHPAMHPGRCARVLVDGCAVGYVGELHPKWRQSWGFAQAPVMFELELDPVLRRTVPAFRPVARHQVVERDIAVVVNERIIYAQIKDTIASAVDAGLLRNVVLFDVFRPKLNKTGELAAPGSLAVGEKSMAIRLVLGGETALTELQIDTAVQTIVEQLGLRHGARLRA